MLRQKLRHTEQLMMSEKEYVKSLRRAATPSAESELSSKLSTMVHIEQWVSRPGFRPLTNLFRPRPHTGQQLMSGTTDFTG